MQSLQRFYKSPPKVKGATASAKAVVFVRKKKILLLKKRSGEWDLPGGWLESGEAWADGLAREVFEESGLKIKRARWVAGWKKRRSKNKKILKGVFLCRLDCKPKKSRITTSSEHVAGGFFSLKEIKNMVLPEKYIQAIDMAAQKLSA